MYENLKISIGMYEPVSLTVKNFLAHYFGLHVTTYLKTNLVLHCVNAVLLRRLCARWICLLPFAMPLGADFVCRVSRLLFLACPGARTEQSQATTATIVAVALISSSPLRIEVVGWSSCLPYILAGNFSLIALLCHMAYRRTEKTHYTILSVLAFLAAGTSPLFV